VFGTRVAETILASVHERARQQAGHMDASDLIEHWPGHSCEEGAVHIWIKEGKGAIKWTRLSCRTLAANAVRLQLHALAYNLGNFMRTLAMPKAAEPWSLTSLREKLIKIGAKVVSHGVSIRQVPRLDRIRPQRVGARDASNARATVRAV
jgi:hypothetical protein